MAFIQKAKREHCNAIVTGENPVNINCKNKAHAISRIFIVLIAVLVVSMGLILSDSYTKSTVMAETSNTIMATSSIEPFAAETYTREDYWGLFPSPAIFFSTDHFNMFQLSLVVEDGELVLKTPSHSGSWEYAYLYLRDSSGNSNSKSGSVLHSLFQYSSSSIPESSITNLKAQSIKLSDYFTIRENVRYYCYLVMSYEHKEMIRFTNNYYSNIADCYVGGSVELPQEPIVDGYSFVGWYYNEDFTTPYGGEPIYGDTMLYAKLMPINYNIIYNLSDGTLVDQITSYNIESDTIVYQTPTRHGYSFGGWYPTSDFSGEPVIGVDTGSIGHKIIYAKWVLINYTITYNLNGGELSGEQTVFTVISDNITYPTPTKDGYSFAGWYTTTEFETVVTGIPKGSTEDRIIFAKWNVVKYSITYNTNGGTVDGTIKEYTIENAVTLPIPTRVGHIFKGWYTDVNLSGLVFTTLSSGSTGNRVYYAKWEICKYTVSFFVGGTLYSSMVVEHGMQFSRLSFIDMETLATVPLFLNEDMTENYNVSSEVTEDMTFFAPSSFNFFVSLTYMANGQKIVTDLLEYNQKLSDLRQPNIFGYDFLGWYYDEDFTEIVSSEDKITANTVVYAKLRETAVKGSATTNFLDWATSTQGIVILAVVGLCALGGAGYAIYAKKKRS